MSQKSFIIILFLFASSAARTFKKCELAQELTLKHKISQDESSIWTCIADKLNNDLNTNVTKSDTFGIFAIRGKYWCSKTIAEESRCGITCDKLLDDDITDDLSCVRDVINSEKSYKKKFAAWPVYEEYCQVAAVKYKKDCFGNNNKNEKRKNRAIHDNLIEEEQGLLKKLQLGVNWDSFGREPDYFLNEMYSDQPKRLKRIN